MAASAKKNDQKSMTQTLKQMWIEMLWIEYRYKKNYSGKNTEFGVFKYIFESWF